MCAYKYKRIKRIKEKANKSTVYCLRGNNMLKLNEDKNAISVTFSTNNLRIVC